MRALVLCMLGAIGLALCVASQGCAWLSSGAWKKPAKIALTSKEAALATADKFGMGYYDRRCRSIAKKCPPGSDNKTCKPLGECWTQRRLLQAVLDRTAVGIAAAWTALAAADQEGFQAKLAVVVLAFGDLSKMLSGVIPGGVL